MLAHVCSAEAFLPPPTPSCARESFSQLPPPPPVSPPYRNAVCSISPPPPTTPHPLVSCIRAQPRAGNSGQEQFFPGHSRTAASCFHKASSPPLAAPGFSTRTPPITPTSATSPNSPLCDHFRTSRGLSHLPPTAPNLSVPLLIWQNWNTTQSGSRECCLSWCVCIWGSEELKFQNYFFFF